VAAEPAGRALTKGESMTRVPIDERTGGNRCDLDRDPACPETRVADGILRLQRRIGLRDRPLHQPRSMYGRDKSIRQNQSEARRSERGETCNMRPLRRLPAGARSCWRWSQSLPDVPG